MIAGVFLVKITQGFSNIFEFAAGIHHIQEQHKICMKKEKLHVRGSLRPGLISPRHIKLIAKEHFLGRFVHDTGRSV